VASRYHNVLQALVDVGTLRIEVLPDFGGQRIKLNGSEFQLVLQASWRQTYEVANACSRLKDPATIEANALQAFVDPVDNNFRGVVRVLGRSARSLVFLCSKEICKGEVFFLPVGVLVIECLGKSTPPDIANQNRLFFLVRLPVCFAELLYELEGRDVVAEFCLGSAVAKRV
jgi:hypothetical protein